jgi:hypothetical protein
MAMRVNGHPTDRCRPGSPLPGPRGCAPESEKRGRSSFFSSARLSRADRHESARIAPEWDVRGLCWAGDHPRRSERASKGSETNSAFRFLTLSAPDPFPLPGSRPLSAPRAAEQWQCWMANQLGQRHPTPSLPHGYRIRAVDATTVSRPGRLGTDWRIPFSVNLEDLQCVFSPVTDVGGGETFQRRPVSRIAPENWNKIVIRRVFPGVRKGNQATWFFVSQSGPRNKNQV